ncbi:MAG: sugar phosphate isomerase/epimerase [Clostridia bacterium]|nr:sugar phosphate isomerase/epimerase [Clostridia bacterium]
MKKSVNVYYTNAIDTKQKINNIKAAGFNELFVGVYDEKESISFADQIAYAKSLGLDCTMIHCSYFEPELDNFWLAGEIGENICKSYISQIEKCKGLSQNFVVHLHGSENSTTSAIGLTRIKKLLDACQKANINLCIENLYSTQEIPYIFKNLSHPKLKICFDTGHRNFLTPNFDIVSDFGKHIAVLHIHDNDGIDDLHNVIGNGNIDWQTFAKQISIYPHLVLSAEIKYNDPTNVLENQIQEFNKLDKLIENYTKNGKN